MRSCSLGALSILALGSISSLGPVAEEPDPLTGGIGRPFSGSARATRTNAVAVTNRAAKRRRAMDCFLPKPLRDNPLVMIASYHLGSRYASRPSRVSSPANKTNQGCSSNTLHRDRPLFLGLLGRPEQLILQNLTERLKELHLHPLILRDLAQLFNLFVQRNEPLHFLHDLAQGFDHLLYLFAGVLARLLGRQPSLIRPQVFIS